MKFHAMSRSHRSIALRLAAAAALMIGATAVPVSAATPAAAPTPAPTTTLDRIKATGKIKLGYIADARPFTHKTDAGAVEGYAADLCNRVVEKVKARTGVSTLTVEWIAVTPASHIDELKAGNVDLLCTPTSETAAKREVVSYSKPIFPGGVRAIVRKDTGAALRQVLGEVPKAPRTVWRGSPAATVLNKGKFGVMAGTTTERWLISKMSQFQIDATMVPVPDYSTGLKQLMDRNIDVFFGDRAIAMGAVDLTKAGSELEIFERWFTNEPLSMALPRNDDDFRLAVDSALSETYADARFPELVSKWSGGAMDEKTRSFFQWVTFAP